MGPAMGRQATERVRSNKTTGLPKHAAPPGSDLPNSFPRGRKRPGYRANPVAVWIEKGEKVMKKWIAKIRDFLKREEGPTAVEYAVMLALIIVVCIAAIASLGSGASNTFNNVSLNAAAGS